MEPEVIEALAQQAATNAATPKQIRKAARAVTRSAAATTHIPTSEWAQLSALRRHRITVTAACGFAMFVFIGAGFSAPENPEPAAETAARIVTLAVVIPAILALAVCWRWRTDPYRLQQVYARRHLVKQTAPAVEARARDLRKELDQRRARAEHFVAPSAPDSAGPVFQGDERRNPRDAEFFAGEALRQLGGHNVQVTKGSGDRGIDVTADGYVAEVKDWATPVPEGPVQRLYGAAQRRGDVAIFFAFSGYRPNAIEFATDTGVALIQYDRAGKLTACSPVAVRVLSEGL